MAILLFLVFHPADKWSGFHLGFLVSRLNDSNLSYPFSPPTIVLLVSSKEYSLFISFSAYLSTISTLFSLLIISDVLVILLISSWFKVALLVASGIALLLCSTMLGIIFFSKYWKMHLFSDVILISRSKVGNHPPNMSSFSIVRFNHPHMPFINSFITSVVFSSGVMFISSSSFLHSDLYWSSPSSTLHPSLMACSHTRMSSM